MPSNVYLFWVDQGAATEGHVAPYVYWDLGAAGSSYSKAAQ